MQQIHSLSRTLKIPQGAKTQEVAKWRWQGHRQVLFCLYFFFKCELVTKSKNQVIPIANLDFQHPSKKLEALLLLQVEGRPGPSSTCPFHEGREGRLLPASAHHLPPAVSLPSWGPFVNITCWSSKSVILDLESRNLFTGDSQSVVRRPAAAPGNFLEMQIWGSIQKFWGGVQ